MLWPWLGHMPSVHFGSKYIMGHEDFKVRQTLHVTQCFSNSCKGKDVFNERKFCLEAKYVREMLD